MALMRVIRALVVLPSPRDFIEQTAVVHWVDSKKSERVADLCRAVGRFIGTMDSGAFAMSDTTYSPINTAARNARLSS